MADLRPPRSGLPLVQLLPNAITLVALCLGLTAIRFAAEGRFELAIALILLAGLLDGLDGQLARRLGSESAIGAELDSLCDFVSFGVAPALTLYLWAFGAGGDLGWGAALIYVVACGLRLARFNIDSQDADGEPKPKDSFTGVPSPAGAMMALLPLYLANLAPSALVLPKPVTALWIMAVGALMVSRLPTPAFRPGRIRPEWVRMILLAMVALGALLLAFPWLTLVLLTLAYLAVLVRGCHRAGWRTVAKEK